MDEVLFSVNDHGVARITLNRPKALNSLTTVILEQIKEKLQQWEKDENVFIVILEGAGGRGLCAGGDIKMLYEAKDSPENMEAALEFFTVEYVTDELIYNFSKPMIANLDGIVMGGGVGLSYGANYRIVTERTKWAMPEMNIGFFPDVGAAYFLNKAPGHLGRYLALTAETITAADVLYINGANAYIPSERLDEFFETLEQTAWRNEDTDDRLKTIIESYNETPENESTLAGVRNTIDEHFKHETVEEIITSLSEDSSEFAQKTKETMLSKSPVSLKVTLKQLITGEGQSLKQCLDTDFILAKNFMKHEDFYEGVRSVLIDRDRNPQYKYKELSDVSDDFVASFFK